MSLISMQSDSDKIGSVKPLKRPAKTEGCHGCHQGGFTISYYAGHLNVEAPQFRLYVVPPSKIGLNCIHCMGASRQEEIVRAASLTGTVLMDRYEVQEEIGRGALGIVYKGWHRQIDKPIAIKVLFQETDQNQTGFLRFQREAESASQISHHNVITIFDFGLSEERFPFLVMDYIKGRSLRDVIKENSGLETSRAIPIFLQICDGMQHAHRKEILHRDLKPDNIVLTEFGGNPDFVKIVDFGIAKIMYEQRKSKRKLTMEGQVVGTPAYMSPEQIMGRPLDPRSDIYTMGVLMFNTLTGVLPILGGNSTETMTKHVTNDPLEFGKASKKQIPLALQAVILTALSKFPENRQQSMDDLATDLRRCTGF